MFVFNNILSLTQVTKQLYQQSHKRLKQSAKSHGLSLYERLLFLDAEMQIFVSSFDSETSTIVGKLVDAELQNRLADRFRGLFLYQAGKGYRPFFGEVEEMPTPSSAQIRHAAAGKPAIITKYSSKAIPTIFILRLLSKQDENAVFLIGEVNPSYLWGVDHENLLPYGVDVCVLDESNHLLFSSFSGQLALLTHALPEVRSPTSDLFELMIGDDRYLAM